MPSDSSGDPTAGRVRRPSKARTFQPGKVDPIIEQRRPLLTWGNLILVVIMVAYGLYATGNLPQLDAALDSMNNQARAKNDFVVHALITYGPYLFLAIVVAIFGFSLFLYINSRRRQLSDPKGWHKVADARPIRRHSSRRAKTADLPSLVMPLGKERTPGHRATDAPASTPEPAVVAAVTAAADTPAPAAVDAKAAAIAAAAKAEAAATTTPVDPPSFVKAPKLEPAATAKLEAAVTDAPVVKAPTIDPAKAAAIAAAAKAEAAAATAPVDPPSFVKAPKLQAVPPAPAKTAAVSVDLPLTKPNIAEADALAAVAKAEAALAAAKAEVAMAAAQAAAAKAEAAMAEAAIAAAKAEIALAATPAQTT